MPWSTSDASAGAEDGEDLASSSVDMELCRELRRMRARKVVLGTLVLEYVLGSLGLPRRCTLASAGEEVGARGDEDSGRVDTTGPEEGNCASLGCAPSGSVFGVMLDVISGVAESVVNDDVLELTSDAGAVAGIGVLAFLGIERGDALRRGEAGTTDADDGLTDCR